MSSYPETIDVFNDLDSADNISSSDPNHAFESVENIEGFVGGLGKPQTWSETLLSVMRNYRRGMRVDYAGGVLYARAGEAILVSSDQNKTVFRRNASDVELTAANVDDGTLIANEFYYVYAKGGTLALTAPICFSSSDVQPSGIGTAPFMKLGWFYNLAGGALSLSYAGSHKDGSADVPNSVSQLCTVAEVVRNNEYAAFGTTPATINMVTHGRPVELIFNSTTFHGINQYMNVAFFVDSVMVAEMRTRENSEFDFMHLHWLDASVIAGTHVFEAQVKTTGGDYGRFYGAFGGGGPRMFAAKEL